MIFHDSKSKVGIEITASHIKIVALQQVKGRAEVSFLEAIDIKDAAEDKAVDMLREGLRNAKLKGQPASLVLPVSSAIMKVLQIPSLNDSEIRDILNLQAGRQTPYSRDEIIMDYIKLGVYQSVYTKVLVIMVTKEVINKQLSILAQAGVPVAKIVFAAEGVGSFCSKKMRKVHADGATRAVMNVDSDNTDVNICGDNGILFARNVPVGLRNISEDRAAATAHFTDEVKKSVEAYQVEDISRSPEEAFMCRNEATQFMAEGQFGKDVGLEVKSYDLIAAVPVRAPYDKLINAANTPSFFDVICCLIEIDALAINLIPEEIKIHQAFEDKMKRLLMTGVFFMVIFFQICLIFVSRMYYKEKYLNSLKDTFAEKIGEADKLRDISEKTSAVRNYLGNKTDAVDIIAKLYDMLPGEIYLKGITIDKDGKIFIKGTSKSMSRIFAFVTELENDKLYASVKTEFTEARKEEGEDVSDFGIVMTVER